MLKVQRTKSGVFLRDEGDGTYTIYSPYSGLVFAAKETKDKALKRWLNKGLTAQPPLKYKKALGAGWDFDYAEASYPQQHLLTDEKAWGTYTPPQNPILINWLITGTCVLKCKYCYAQDLMGENIGEPTEEKAIQIAESILRCKPLVVVLTGGEPLLSSNLEPIIKHLHNKCGLIVDSSGSGLTQKHLRLFAKYNILVRVSLDSEIAKINDMQRPNRSKKGQSSTQMALDAIIECLNAGVRVGVQTVITKKNKNDLEALGDKLFSLGATYWRLMRVASSGCSQKGYLQLKESDIGLKRTFKHIRNHIRTRHSDIWHPHMSFQFTRNETPNDVILVAPEGKFYTESNAGSGKELLFDSTVEKIDSTNFAKVDSYAHADRYIHYKK